MLNFAQITGFDWDAGNDRKNERHRVSQAEAEQAFFDPGLLVVADERHSMSEPRFHGLGSSAAGRLLHVTFTLRLGRTKLRVISAAMQAAKKGHFMNKRQNKTLPRFASEAAERKYWETHDSGTIIDWSTAMRTTLPNLKPNPESIPLRLPVKWLERIKNAAISRDLHSAS